MVEWKHQQAERDVEGLLRAAARHDPAVLDTFPRSIVDILSASLPAVDVITVNGLDTKAVVERLADAYAIDQRCLLDDGNAPLGGFTYADKDRALIFVETSYGPEFETFTLAHEAGHIVKELLPRLGARGQGSLFGGPPIFVAHRDPPEVLIDASAVEELALPLEERLRALKAKADAWLREVKANSCAAELLAPWRDVQRLARDAPEHADLVELARERYGISRGAARVRLRELGLLGVDPHGPRML